ncbi:hypothetical protein O6H91_02G042800 [Diphasiastrum complanatum]|uniref:Uncharacterized protein n=1 Tax=Diphasiastrum complanatum TaxID=34168 RepID=A0ACC2EF41_DIPCM|nr:hypothetical protein O6H91_02G042800 [Diphasiastrum complanatum]
MKMANALIIPQRLLLNFSQSCRQLTFISSTLPSVKSYYTTSQKSMYSFINQEAFDNALFQASLGGIRCMSIEARAGRSRDAPNSRQLDRASGTRFSFFPTESHLTPTIMQLQRGKRPSSQFDKFGNPSKENAYMFKSHQMNRKNDPLARPSISYKQSISEEEKQLKVKRNEPATRPASAKASTLVHMILPLSSVKEEVYSALDSWSAWDYKFPMVAVKKALKILKDKQQWQRIIQVSKWMLSKGQGKTLGTYDLLIQALDEDGRLEEAEAVWTSLVLQNIESVPRMMYARMICIYEKRGMFDRLLKVFKDMEDMSVKPDEGTVNRVARTYEKLGLLDKKERHSQKYSKVTTERKFKGKRASVKFTDTYDT